jgi:hypothetical protein
VYLNSKASEQSGTYRAEKKRLDIRRRVWEIGPTNRGRLGALGDSVLPISSREERSRERKEFLRSGSPTRFGRLAGNQPVQLT